MIDKYDENEAKATLNSIKTVVNTYKKIVRYPMYKAVTFVLLWRLFSMLPFEKDFEKHVDSIDEVLTPLVIANIDGKNELATYSHHLTLVFVAAIFH